jgi:3-hydroxyisobutyrate dehydrogenase-like beta-hydroxyacid dehydrogenase
MGAPMAANIARAGFPLTVFDRAGTEERAPAGTSAAGSAREVALAAKTVFLSVPDGAASLDVAREIIATPGRATSVVIDLSTIGIAAARAIDTEFAAAGIAYVDAPVSGGRSGAIAATIAIMWAGPADLFERHRPVLEAFGKPFVVGDTPGKGQAMKLANNFLAATGFAATSEAVHFGLSQGLDMQTMLEVLAASSGQNVAVSDRFPKRIVTGTYDGGFRTALMRKDVDLYLEAARAAGTHLGIGGLIDALWRNVDDAMPGSDSTEMYRFFQQRLAAEQPGEA